MTDNDLNKVKILFLLVLFSLERGREREEQVITKGRKKAGTGNSTKWSTIRVVLFDVSDVVKSFPSI